MNQGKQIPFRIIGSRLFRGHKNLFINHLRDNHPV